MNPTLIDSGCTWIQPCFFLTGKELKHMQTPQIDKGTSTFLLYGLHSLPH